MNRNKGMVTLEAAVIIPISLTVIMLVLWTGFYFYNRNILDQAASFAAVNGAQKAEKDNAVVSSYVMDEFREHAGGKIIMMDEPVISVNVTNSLIEVNVKGNMPVPLGIIFGDTYKTRNWNIDITQYVPRFSPSVFIRTVSRVKNGLDNHIFPEGE